MSSHVAHLLCVLLLAGALGMCQANLQPLEPTIWGTDVSIKEMHNLLSTVAVIGDFSQTTFFGDLVITPCDQGAYLSVYSNGDMKSVILTSDDSVNFSGIDTSGGYFVSTLLRANVTVFPEEISSLNIETVKNEVQGWDLVDSSFVYALQLASFAKSSKVFTFSGPIAVADGAFVIHDIDIVDDQLVIVGELGEATQITFSDETELTTEGFQIHLTKHGDSEWDFESASENANPILYLSHGAIVTEEEGKINVFIGESTSEYLFSNIEITSFYSPDGDTAYIGGYFTGEFDLKKEESTAIGCTFHGTGDGKIAVSVIISVDSPSICVFGTGVGGSEALSAHIVDQAVDEDYVYSLGYFGKKTASLPEEDYQFQFGDCCSPTEAKYTSFVLKLSNTDLSCVGIQVFGVNDAFSENARGQDIGTSYIDGTDAVVAAYNPIQVQGDASVTTIPIVPVSITSPACSSSPPPEDSNSNTSGSSNTASVSSDATTDSSDATTNSSTSGDNVSVTGAIGDTTTSNNSYMTIIFVIIVGIVLIGGIVGLFLYKKRNQLIPAQAEDPLNRFSQLEEEFN